MIGDPNGVVTINFEVMREGIGLADRATFLIDPDGIIQAMEITAEGIGRDAEDLMRKVKAAQYVRANPCLLYTSPSPRDQRGSRMPSSA